MKKYIPLMVLALALSNPSSGHAQDPGPKPDLWKKAIEKGDKDAQYNLGALSFTEGRKDEGWLRKIVDQGNFTGAYCQGMNFSHSKEFSEWLPKEAGQGNARAQYCLGVADWGNNKNIEAVEWLRKAAEQGDADAQDNLGLAYMEGNPSRGVERDKKEALKWYSKAAAQGNVHAQTALKQYSQ